jgi:hypothetical protein
LIVFKNLLKKKKKRGVSLDSKYISFCFPQILDFKMPFFSPPPFFQKNAVQFLPFKIFIFFLNKFANFIPKKTPFLLFYFFSLKMPPPPKGGFGQKKKGGRKTITKKLPHFKKKTFPLFKKTFPLKKLPFKKTSPLKKLKN